VNRYPITSWLQSEESPDVSVICGTAGRLLIALACIVLVAMPWTEYFWRFDKFLRGGQDFELGILALITFLCLVLVLAQRMKRDMTRLLAVRQFFSFFFKDPGSVPAISSKTLETFHSERISCPSSPLCALPLQI
jgi:hypothetical protein